MKFQAGDIVSPNGGEKYRVMKSYSYFSDEKEYVDLLSLATGEQYYQIYDPNLKLIKRKSPRNGHHLTGIFK